MVEFEFWDLVFFFFVELFEGFFCFEFGYEDSGLFDVGFEVGSEVSVGGDFSTDYMDAALDYFVECVVFEEFFSIWDGA